MHYMHVQLSMHRSWDSYQFVATDYGHDAERLNTMLLRIERRACVIVSKDNVGVDLGVEIGDPNIVAGDIVLELRLGLSIATASASSVFASTALLAVAIDVHVNELFSVAVQVDNAGCGILTVPKS